jgi:EamA domain-containing membrane protein RarD
MLKTELTLPELGLLAGTRGLFGAGLGLLLAHRLNPEQRRSIAWTLIAVGALTTIPLAMIVFGNRRRVEAGT